MPAKSRSSPRRSTRWPGRRRRSPRMPAAAERALEAALTAREAAGAEESNATAAAPCAGGGGRRRGTRRGGGAAADLGGRAVDPCGRDAPRARRARSCAASGTAGAPRRGIAHAVDHRDRAGRRRRRAAAPGAGGARPQRIRSQRAARHGTGAAGAPARRKRSRAGRRSQAGRSRGARLGALPRLQDAIGYGKDSAAWLAQKGLTQAHRLWQGIDIEPGWEDALESVLRERLNAIELDRLDAALRWVDADADGKAQGLPGRIAAYSPEGGGNAPSGPADALLAKVRTARPGWRASWPTGCAASAAARPRRGDALAW